MTISGERGGRDAAAVMARSPKDGPMNGGAVILAAFGLAGVVTLAAASGGARHGLRSPERTAERSREGRGA